jgi:hypothetical protein
MNERIQDILDQPIFERLKDWAKIGPVQKSTMEEFVALLVEECGEVAYKTYWDNPEKIRGTHLKEAIKEHFGVEK